MLPPVTAAPQHHTTAFGGSLYTKAKLCARHRKARRCGRRQIAGTAISAVRADGAAGKGNVVVAEIVVGVLAVVAADGALSQMRAERLESCALRHLSRCDVDTSSQLLEPHWGAGRFVRIAIG